MEQYLNEFKDFLEKIDGNNLVLGGIHAIRAHGLMFSRATQDLDIIIYGPTQKQLDVIQSTSPDMEPSDREGDYQTDPDDPRRSYKFQKNGMIIDILIEYYAVKPQHLLHFKHEDKYFQVQGVSFIIDAKRMYGREKDYKDFEDLKNSNFNK